MAPSPLRTLLARIFGEVSGWPKSRYREDITLSQQITRSVQSGTVDVTELGMLSKFVLNCRSEQFPLNPTLR